MPLTFAYGSNMCVADMAARCPHAKMLGMARLPKFRFALLPDGFATLVRDPAALTYGVLWELSFGALAALDRYEGVAQGAYEKLILPVIRDKGGAVRALVYLGRPEASLGRAPADYMEKIIASAVAHGFPREHVEFLRACGGISAPAEPPPKFRAIKNESML
ncbi:gamma-glutamylcyclotransferase [Rhodoblastus acidophilus]|uniref:Gamma-glutamylcyclotransferase n=1 Tax=Rhodoblastus acidophilus TaxID=1074 RepID=A0A6N8DKB4_RHOAC|nr:gamma-glutamylcyclotransferase family protein [Rhodoblastus acidophilus]MCW2273852.1 cation transport regulator ChaC [Rhodoblastus acidophilus]MTV31002.1 gamma-glutamylcyclotransferase [Rhodoblastus acidophilus]